MMISNNKLGNPYHDELGRFTRAENVADKIETQSSGYTKNKYLQGKTWEELGKMGKRNEFIEVNYTTPMALKLFSKALIDNTEIQDLWEPADPDQKLDKDGVDVVGVLGNKSMYRIDFKCSANQLGNEIDVKSAMHNIILFRFDPKTKNPDAQGWIFKHNSTDIVGFVAINTPHNQEELFNLGEERLKYKNMKSASLVLVNKATLYDYVLNNFNSEEWFLKQFQSIRNELEYNGKNAKAITIEGKDGLQVKMVVSYDKVTHGYSAGLKISVGSLQRRCKGRVFWYI